MEISANDVTTSLLQQVALKLNHRIVLLNRKRNIKDLNMTTNTESHSSFLDVIRKRFRISEIEPSETSEKCKLFAVIDYGMRKCSFIPTHADIDCKINYSEGIISYNFLSSKKIELSVIEERCTTKIDFYHLIFELPSNPFAYRSIEIDPCMVPSFKTDNFSIQNDFASVASIFDSISLMAEKFGWKYTDEPAKSIKIEFSNVGLKPVLPPEAIKTPPPIPSRKRKASASPDADSIDENHETEDETSSDMPKNYIYDSLSQLFEKCATKPNQNARLFAVIHSVLVREMDYTCDFKNEWPGVIDNQGQSFTFAIYRQKDSTAELFGNFFSVAVLNNGRDFFVSVRIDTTNKCLKKITKNLVPSFEGSQKKLDIFRIANLNRWVIALNDGFIKPYTDPPTRKPGSSKTSSRDSSTSRSGSTKTSNCGSPTS